MDIGAIWDIIILKPMINSMISLSQVLWGSFGLTIIILTLIVRGVMYPLTIKQLRASKAMQSLQPKLAALQKKHGADKEKLAQEQMRLYKESGVSPSGCLLPMLIQMPIWIALYQAIIRVMAVNPESFLNLSHYLYSWPIVYEALPLNNHFLWLNLATPDYLLAILVGLSMFIQQKMTQAPVTAGASPAQSQAQSMTVMMPLMFTFLSMSFPSGLALYWVTSNILSFVKQYFITGWGGLEPMKNRLIERISGLLSRKNFNDVKTRVIHSGDKTAPDVTSGEDDVLIGDLKNDNGKDEDGLAADQATIAKKPGKDKSKSQAKKGKRSKRK
ncbi:MAG: YidC/Oxa1 family membrane protein insertase [Dehalococcoidales bacterium]|nr:YidC/Oxa1 family membrane protein insertase [Dehalococcoidales bacterium]